MVQGVKGLPAELKILALGDVEIFGQGRVHVPEAGSAHVRQHRTHVSELPGIVRGRIVIRPPDTLVRTEGRFKGLRVNPIGNLLLLRRVSDVRITDQITPRSISGRNIAADGSLEGIPRAANVQRYSCLGHKVPCELPSARNLVHNTLLIQEGSARAKG